MSSSKHEIPVLILSVLSSEKDVLLGLKKGAVDYVPKPFSLPVLMQKALSLIKG
jgi:DNA-binding response OmpR family regulator